MFGLNYSALLVLVFSTALTLVEAKETNFQRLARGLPPQRPRQLFNPTRTNAARSVPSGDAYIGTQVPGNIGLYGSGISGKRDNLIGYLDGSGQIRADLSNPNAWTKFKYTIGSDPSVPISVINYHWTADYDFIPLIQTYQYEAYLETGPVYTDSCMAPGHSNYAKFLAPFSHNGDAQPNQPPKYVQFGGSGWMETSVYVVEPGTGRVTIQWTCKDGTQNPMSICVHQQADGFNYLVITGDEALATPALVAANGGTVECGIDLVFDESGTISK